MAPSTILDEARPVEVSSVKVSKGQTKHQYAVEPNPPVADDFMYDFKYNHDLPTIDVLGVDIPADVDTQKEAEGIVARLSEVLAAGDANGFTDLFLEYGYWRDKLAFTWDYRTFNFQPAIRKAAGDLLARTKAHKFAFLTPSPKIDRPYPDYATLQFILSFETEIVKASAVINAVLTKEGWRIYTLHTVAEELLQFPEIQSGDGHMTGSISWEKQREKDIDAANPEVLIIGGGQNGLAVAARCKFLGLQELIIEQSDAIGDIWRKRYEYLSLHMPHWPDDLPYFSYPKHWPTYTPAQKQGYYMQWYASALELNVWTKSTVVSAEQDGEGRWTVVINKGGQEHRTLHPAHVIMATSLCGLPYTPDVPGLADYKAGVVRHSTAHDSSRDFVGKKVLVVGTSSSGFDTAFDCSRRGIDVTLLQRSPTYVMSLTHSVPRAIGNYAPDADGNRPPLEEQDRLFFALPVGPAEELGRRNAQVLEDLDRELLDGLHAAGLRTWRGQRGTGNMTLGKTRNGGFYFDAGACEHVINGKIKVEPGYIERFTENKVILDGGRERQYDLVVFATGFSSLNDSVRSTLGDTIANQVRPIWGVDAEGEYKMAYRETGVKNLWIMVGFLPYARFHSKLLALRIKALKEGISPPPYKE
ncbi:flavin-containing monooxygenase [Niveomyces insectorum RCEF 264]|uniref:Flavin-containing monooxygenase n=1 Tax=Niveomyces insectorum RCEF 264 TaxID=1081102 RepID=A0A167SLA2_9HYPO|nr:flavin-containing monooxygenase [Niveomyces insectorum RCEF 264]